MRGIMEEYGEVKSLKLRFHPNNARNEAMICFSSKNKDTTMAPVTLFLMSLLLTLNIICFLFLLLTLKMYLFSGFVRKTWNISLYVL